MKTNQKQNINEQMLDYLSTGDPATFEEGYSALRAKYQRQLERWEMTTSGVNEHDLLELFDDTLLKTLAALGQDEGHFEKLFHRSLYNGFKSLLRKIRTRRDFEEYEAATSDEDAATFEIADEFDLEEHVVQKKEADQRQLIDSLLSDADETTTAIVESFLQHPKPNPTAIGKVLGVHHSTIIRKLERLAANFDSKQHGDYRDYLVAI